MSALNNELVLCLPIRGVIIYLMEGIAHSNQEHSAGLEDVWFYVVDTGRVNQLEEEVPASLILFSLSYIVQFLFFFIWTFYLICPPLITPASLTSLHLLSSSPLYLSFSILHCPNHIF